MVYHCAAPIHRVLIHTCGVRLDFCQFNPRACISPATVEPKAADNSQRLFGPRAFIMRAIDKLGITVLV